MEPLVSIIIPTYNRKHLISETLDSISVQSYTNWECLIVDDCSTDDSLSLIKAYCLKDIRFRFFVRPESRLKGANTCRNIGLEKCQGAFVVFFDSDDIMTPDHLETKINAIEAYHCDYVITKTQFFNSDADNELLETNYNFNSEDISAYNYITQSINWLTYDICLKSSIAKRIAFNEHLKAGQEYNYFSKLTLKTINAVFVKKVVTLRRHHDVSIRGNLRGDKIASIQSYIHTYWHTYEETKRQASKKNRQFLAYKCFKLSLKLSTHERLYSADLNKALFREFGLKGLYFILKLRLNHSV